MVFTQRGSNGIPLKLPCGQCVGCRTDRRKEWATRLVHESRLHAESCFITLTYDPDCLPRGGTLVPEHATLWLKRLRKLLAGRGQKIRYFLAGEYGERSRRPHYHAIVFGYWPRDAVVISEGSGQRLFTSEELSKCWKKGFVSVGSVTAESCGYTAAYCVKKVTGAMALEHYTRVMPDGEMVEVVPEFARMSRRPGLGAGFYESFRDELVGSDFALLQGRKVKLPRYYDKLRERSEGEAVLADVKLSRVQKARVHRANNTPERLEARLACAESKRSFNLRKESL